MKKQIFYGSGNVVDYVNKKLLPVVKIVVEGDEDVEKLWLKTFIRNLDGFRFKKLELADWIIENVNEGNQFIATQEKIHRETGYSRGTIKEVMTMLQQSNPPVLLRVQSGVYSVNPAIRYRGGECGDRMGIMYYFKKEKK